MAPKASFIQIKTVENKMHFHYNIVTNLIPEKDKSFSCYIPAYDIYFSASSEEMISKKSKAFVRMIFDHFLVKGDNPKNRLKNFIFHIHKLGFNAPMHNMVLKQVIEHKAISTKFNSLQKVKPEFKDSKELVSELELAY